MKMEESKIKNCAVAIVKGTGKMLSVMEKLSMKMTPLVQVPFVGETIADVQDVVYMLNDYYRGDYKKIPVSAILGCLGIIAYLASPIDLVPDNIPILGFLDDAFIINIIMELCVSRELENYRKWKAEQQV